MNEARRPEKGLFREVLVILGTLAILIGIGTILLGVFVIRPQLEDLISQLDKSLGAVEEVLSDAGQFPETLQAPIELSQSVTGLTEVFPEVLITTKGVLYQFATTLETTGESLDNLTGGLPSIVLPDAQVNRNARDASKAGTQLRLLADLLNSMVDASYGIAKGADDLNFQVSRLRENLPAVRASIRESEQLVREVRAGLNGAIPELGMVGLSVLYGGTYIFLGSLFLVLAKIYKEFLQGLRAMPLDQLEEEGRVRRAS